MHEPTPLRNRRIGRDGGDPRGTPLRLPPRARADRAHADSYGALHSGCACHDGCPGEYGGPECNARPAADGDGGPHGAAAAAGHRDAVADADANCFTARYLHPGVHRDYGDEDPGCDGDGDRRRP